MQILEITFFVLTKSFNYKRSGVSKLLKKNWAPNLYISQKHLMKLVKKQF